MDKSNQINFFITLMIFITFFRMIFYNKLNFNFYLLYTTMFCFGLFVPVLLTKTS